MWGILQDKVYKTCTTDLDHLKHRIRTEWTKLDRITLSLQLLCISGVVVSQGASRPATVISSTVFDLDIVFSAITTSRTLARFAIRLYGDCLIHKVKYRGVPLPRNFHWRGPDLG